MTLIEQFSRDSFDGALGLQVLFERALVLDEEAVTRSLREYDPTMADASCELDDGGAAQGSPFGVVAWGPHAIRVIGFDVPMPDQVVEYCVQGAHYGQELKAQAREHRAHVLLAYGGSETDPLEKYVALAAVAGALAPLGAIVVANEHAQTSFPAQALARSDDDMIGLLRALPTAMLYSGFVKLQIDGVRGVWMRTCGNDVLGLPDFAYHAFGHNEGQDTFDLIDALMSYLRDSGKRFAPGHTAQMGPDRLRFRAPKPDEGFLASEGEMLVVERI